jgi:hypothetical protein
MTALALVTMTEDDARRLTERIRLTAHTFAESRTKLIALVNEAKDGKAHAALGYASWTAYLSDVLGDEPLRLARDDRKELVGILAAEGMSTRAIAPIVGASQATVAREVRATESFDSDERPATVTSLDGRERPAKVETIRVDPNTGEVLDAKPPIQTYPPKPRRKPFLDDLAGAVDVLDKAVQRLQQLTTDARCVQNAEQAAIENRSDLTRINDALQGVINQLI